MTPDELRSARLLFAPELRAGTIGDDDLRRPEVARAVASRPVPALPRRALQRLAMKTGRLTYRDDCVRALMEARRVVLGNAAGGAPRVLVRVDEFPNVRAFEDPLRFGAERYERFHSILALAGVPYLLAVLPRVPRAPLDPEVSEVRDLDPREQETLARLPGDGVTYGLHGLDHRTRDPRPRRHSELCGLDPDALRGRLDRGASILDALGIHPRVFVPPYNRFDPAQYGELARRFDVVCGGPENVLLMGYHRTPLWREGAVYLPAYAPLYASADDVAGAVSVLAREGAALWVPVVLHWSREADAGWTALEHLAEILAPCASSWDDFLDAVDASG